jgi:hypothetical protein
MRGLSKGTHRDLHLNALALQAQDELVALGAMDCDGAASAFSQLEAQDPPPSTL